MNKLTAKQLLMINRKVTGEDVIPSDALMKKLEQISNLPYEQDEMFFYKYKNTVAKASKLGCSIACIKPFEKQNNKTAVFALLTLLELNRVKLVGYENNLNILINLLEAGDIDSTYRWIESNKYQGDNIE